MGIQPSFSENLIDINDCSSVERFIVLFYSDISNTMKDSTFEDFMEIRIQILVATNVFGVGIDIQNIQRIFQEGVTVLNNLDK